MARNAGTKTHPDKLRKANKVQKMAATMPTPNPIHGRIKHSPAPEKRPHKIIVNASTPSRGLRNHSWFQRFRNSVANISTPPTDSKTASPPPLRQAAATSARICRVAMDEMPASRVFMGRIVVPADRLDDAVAQLAEDVAEKSPVALRLGKESFYRAQDMSFDQALAYLNAMLTADLESEDVVEGVSAFLEKRPPEWKGR